MYLFRLLEESRPPPPTVQKAEEQTLHHRGTLSNVVTFAGKAFASLEAEAQAVWPSRAPSLASAACHGPLALFGPGKPLIRWFPFAHLLPAWELWHLVMRCPPGLRAGRAPRRLYTSPGPQEQVAERNDNGRC
jgi:hypothetical protein